ncbi:hypothetical protein ACH5RR_001336, partial [Cinchona calisaya]
NSKYQIATFEEEVTDLNLYKGKATLIDDDTNEIAPNEDILSMHMDSLETSEGQEAKSENELDLVTGKFTEELLSYFSKLDCPNVDSKEPLSLQEWKTVSRLLAKRIQQVEGLSPKHDFRIKNPW